jgi:hypothetical protein
LCRDGKDGKDHMIKNVWYDLNEIVRSKNIFVFRKALEEILQHAQTPKRQKPVMDLEKNNLTDIW